MHIPNLTAPILNPSSSIQKVLESTTKIRFQHCDPFGHLNNATYLSYLTNEREDQVASAYGLDIYEWGMKQGTSWVVGKHEIIYRKPAFYNEMVTVQSRLIGFADRHIQVEMAMLNAERTHLKAVLWSNFVHVDMKAKRPAAHVQELMDLFAKALSPLSQTVIEDRVKGWETELGMAKA
ncbi:MAG TPA: acyl-CoA thioesterase [Bacteroidetes bacterium]|nr:acyl-CoA thioesterase [Bacteroidota bacterium]